MSHGQRARRRLPVRHLHRRAVHHRRALLSRGQRLTLLAVLGPGLLAGLSDDDPAGITTYSVLGARYGYQLLWVLLVSTVALIVFHQLGARLGVVTGRGLTALIRERYGHRAAAVAVVALLVANLGTMSAEMAGIAAAGQILGGVAPWLSVPVAGVAVVALVTRGSLHRVEHVLLALCAVFVTYVISGFLSGPDWGAAVQGAVVPSMPLTRDAALIAVATLGTTLAPWGLTFIQSYAVDKHITVDELRYERLDVLTGAVLTGVIGAFIVVCCTATLHASGTSIDDASDAARALKPLAGGLASTLFGLGLLGAALLAAAVVPLSTAYSVSEGAGRPGDLDLSPRDAPLFYATLLAVVVAASAPVVVPGAPLVAILVGTQALNAVLLLAILPFLIALSRDRELMGDHTASRSEHLVHLATFALIAAAIALLGVLQLIG